VFISHSEPANDKVQVITFQGTDQVTGSAGLAEKLMLGVDGGFDADTIQGGDGGDTLAGGDQNDTIRGNAGNDSLLGGLGADFLNGGPGADSFSCGNPGEDTLVTDAFDTIGPDC
jgi:Ca2+-binding RTX toxin-like protein